MAKPVQEWNKGPLVGRFVVIAEGAHLYRQRGDTAPVNASEHHAGAPSSDNAPPRGVTARVEEEEGDWLRVVTVNRRKRTPPPFMRQALHCNGDFLIPPRAYNVSLWVRRENLLPVLDTRLQRSFDDGTWVHLLPGTLVGAGYAFADGLQLPVEIAKSSWSPSYAPEEEQLEGLDGPGSWGSVAPPQFFLNRQPVESHRRANRSSLRGKIREEGYSTFDSACGQYHLKIGTEATRQNLGGGGTLTSPVVKGAVFPKGAALEWEDGQPAGVMRFSDVVAGEVFAEADRVCVSLPLSLSDSRIVVCAQASDVRLDSGEAHGGAKLVNEPSE